MAAYQFFFPLGKLYALLQYFLEDQLVLRCGLYVTSQQAHSVKYIVVGGVKILFDKLNSSDIHDFNAWAY